MTRLVRAVLTSVLFAACTLPDARTCIVFWGGGVAYANEQARAATASQQPDSQMPLLLDEALRNADATHPKLLGAEAERQLARAKRDTKRGAFDTTVFFDTNSQRYNSTSTRGKAANAWTNNAGMEMTTRDGLKMMAGMNLNAGSVKSPLSSTGTGGEYFAGVKMPLARGYRINEKSAAEQQARLGIPLADQNFSATRLIVLRDTAIAYWDWVEAGRKLVVARDLLRVAEDRAGQILIRVDKGDLPEVDSLEAQGEVERRREALAKAERDLEKAALKFGLYRWGPDGSSTGGPPPERVPESIPLPVPLTPEEISDAHARAAAARPELQALSINEAVTRVDLRLARNDMKPGMDFVLTPGLDTGSRAIGDTLKAGFVFSLPLNRWEASGREDEANAKITKIEQDRIFTAEQIETDVNDAVSALSAAERRYQAAQRAATLAEQLEEAERRRFALGEGTLFLVNQRERATAEARARVIEVQADYQRARAALQAASADL